MHEKRKGEGEPGNETTSNLTLVKEICIEHPACRAMANDRKNTDG
jgi:hypothetical protein